MAGRINRGSGRGDRAVIIAVKVDVSEVHTPCIHRVRRFRRCFRPLFVVSRFPGKGATQQRVELAFLFVIACSFHDFFSDLLRLRPL